MKPQLPRELLWTDKKTTDGFLAEPLNRKLYELYIDMDAGATYGRIAPYKVFNEAYYQCTKAVYENRATCDVEQLELDIKANIGTKRASRTVFRLMYAILAMRSNNTREIEAFKDQFDVLNFAMINNKSYLDFIKQARKRKGRQYIDLSPRPYPVERLSFLTPYWPEVTCDFDLEAINAVVDLWPNADDKLKVVEMIENAFKFKMSGKDPSMYSYSRSQRKVVELDLSELKEEIRRADLYPMAAEDGNTDNGNEWWNIESKKPLHTMQAVKIARLENRITEMQTMIERLKSELNSQKSKEKQERSFTLGMILDYCENHTTQITGPTIIGMLNMFLRDAGNSTQAERDLVDKTEHKLLHPASGDSVHGNKSSFSGNSSMVNFNLPEGVDYERFFAAIPDEMKGVWMKQLMNKDNG